VNTISTLRVGMAELALGALALMAMNLAPQAAAEPSNLIHDGKLGFVVADISYGLSNSKDAEVMCPNGLSLGPRDIFAATPEGKRRPDESDADYTRRLSAGAQTVMTAPDGQNLCMHPDAVTPSAHMHPVSGDVSVYGIDIDGQESRANGRAAAGTCAHDDFRGTNGEHGIDNQFFRAVGCTHTFQPGGQANDFGAQMLVGEWGILITLEDVQDLRNDNDVVVRIYANNDPMEVSPNREPLTNATYAFDPDPRYQATTRGRIVDGVLTTNPVDTRFHYVVNSLRLDRVLRAARLRMTINADGSMEGIVAGYSPVEEMYDTVFGFRSGRDGSGQLAQLRARQGSSSGYAFTARHTCNGVYHALRQLADGDPDSANGRCTSISTQYRVKAISAFVVKAETRSVNEDLVK
jgi:hypothetical protein